MRDAEGPFTFFLAWRERRYARSCCRELLTLHRRVRATQPELVGGDLYRKVVAARIGGDLSAADAVVRYAEQSYATWPVERTLTFRDVVHYLAVSEFSALGGSAGWVHVGIKEVVAATIPHDL